MRAGCSSPWWSICSAAGGGLELAATYAAQPGDRRLEDGLVSTKAGQGHAVISLGSRQYASEDFTRLLEEHGITALMSRKGNCWDNACSETLFGSLKVEWLHGKRFTTIREAKDAVLEGLLWYNRNRMHSTLGYSSPAEYEQRWLAQQVKDAATTTM